MKKTKDGFLLSSGREIYAHAHLLSVDEENHIYHGFDGYLSNQNFGEEVEVNDNNLTKEEKIEIADYMLSQWSSFKETLNQ